MLRHFHSAFASPKGSYVAMLAFAIFLELAGGLLLIFNSTLGALLLVSVAGSLSFVDRFVFVVSLGM